MPRLLPLFPLQLVAFPGSAIPLHIFEERYKEMVGAAEADGSEFGVVLAKDGGIVNAGCSVIVESVLERYPDGRFDVVARGVRRFAITAIDEQKEYLRGHVEFFDDEDSAPVSQDLRERAFRAYEHIREALQEAGDDERFSDEPAPDPDDPLVSFQYAQAVDDLDFQNQVLRSRSESERLRHFIDVVKPWLERRHYKAKMQRTAPLNGSGHKPPGI